MKNPSMFIGGCPRSGTTLLRRIVSAHPQIVVTPEEFVPMAWLDSSTATNGKSQAPPEAQRL